MRKTGQNAAKTAVTSGQRQREWRARVPEHEHLVEEVMPQMLSNTPVHQLDDLPREWVQLVAAKRADVHAKAKSAALREYANPKVTPRMRRGYAWSFTVGKFADMFEHLASEIRKDLDFAPEGETLATMLLLKKAFLQLELELQDGGTEDGREDSDEQRLRVLGALKALTTQFDDMAMKRLRALQHAETAAKLTRVATDEEVDRSAENIRDVPGIDLDKHCDYIRYDQPVLMAVLARSWLAEVDDAFATLDPLVVMEEFADARARSKGGKAAGGDGRVGPVRALAKLAVTCGALGYEPNEGETYDDAVDRARRNLLNTRFRARSEFRTFPGWLPEDDDGPGDAPLDTPEVAQADRSLA